MGISLVKGQKINLRKVSGEKLEKFCVEVNWGAIERVKKGWIWDSKEVEDVDLDLSAIVVNSDGKMIDHLYSPMYNKFLKQQKIPLGKLKSTDGALIHSGDDLGKGGGDDFREVIQIDMSQLCQEADRIFFFLNIYLNPGQKIDFSDIPFAQIKMFEGSPDHLKKEHLSFDVVTNESFAGKGALIMGKLYKKNDDWKFDAIGDAASDKIFTHTIQRIMTSYI